MTGGIFVYTGLQAFKQFLAECDCIYDDIAENNDAPRYLILFTDGNDGDKEKAKTEVKKLKDDVYSIFAVKLAKSSVEEGTAAFEQTKSFLVELTGDRSKIFMATNIDEISQMFLGDILSEIFHNLDDCTVKDYINHRFDLVDSNKNTWYPERTAMWSDAPPTAG